MNLNTMGSVEGGKVEAHISPYLGFLLRAIVLKEKRSGSLEGRVFFSLRIAIFSLAHLTFEGGTFANPYFVFVSTPHSAVCQGRLTLSSGIILGRMWVWV